MRRLRRRSARLDPFLIWQNYWRWIYVSVTYGEG